MATAQQIADRSLKKVLAGIEEELEAVNKRLRNYDPLIQQRDRLTAARRALLAERAVTQGGGKGISQAEVINALKDLGDATVSELATKLSATEAVVRGHLNRGKDERFKVELDGGVKKWSLREPEEDDDEDEDDED